MPEGGVTHALEGVEPALPIQDNSRVAAQSQLGAERGFCYAPASFAFSLCLHRRLGAPALERIPGTTNRHEPQTMGQEFPCA
jgi:hypothetical protein